MKPPITIAAVVPWLARWFLKLGWAAVRALWRCAFGLLLAVLVGALVAVPAEAGWFTRKPDPTVEAANRALQHAADTANETARIQADQNIRIAEAVTQLSSERLHLAGHLEHLGQLAAKDSAWATAVNSLGPVLVIVAVLAVGGMALWLVTRAGPADPQLVEVLVDEVAGASPRWLSLEAESGHRRLRSGLNQPALLIAGKHEPDDGSDRDLEWQLDHEPAPDADPFDDSDSENQDTRDQEGELPF
jgi:hypothetical protein